MNLRPVILAGGAGTRLWPLSREFNPKPFLNLFERRSMLQATIDRLDGIEGMLPPAVMCNEEHRFLVSEHIAELGIRPSAIILESAVRNTAPALTIAALVLASDDGNGKKEDPVMLVMPADHLIRDVSAFREAVALGYEFARTGQIVTFGIVPDRVHTGLGYIRKGPSIMGDTAFSLRSFIEKPSQEHAEEMLASGDYLWNSGVFMVQSSVWLTLMASCRPDITEVCNASVENGQWEDEFYRPDPELFKCCKSESIDYAVMQNLGDGSAIFGEHSPGVVVPMQAGWSDIGTWSALWEAMDQDPEGNVVKGEVYGRKLKNSLLIAQHRVVAAVGLEDLIVVATPDVVLVARKDQAQELKELLNDVKDKRSDLLENHPRVHKPWGYYEVIDAGDGFQVKRLVVNPGSSLSLQMHHCRAEHWTVVKGSAKVTRGECQYILSENQSTDIPIRSVHRVENPGDIALEMIEIQMGSYLGEDDIVRYRDRYNRHTK